MSTTVLAPIVLCVLGIIFGAILGAEYGSACYLWIVLGCIFGGAVHDFFIGMLSVRHNGLSLPGLIGVYINERAHKLARVFSLLLLLLLSAVFIYSPALILEGLTGGGKTMLYVWIAIIFGYYILATLVPVDKIIGKIYPIFAFAILFMGTALLFHLFKIWPSSTPEIWEGLQNKAPQNGSLFPCLFISIACGAISGFHATQSPIMARCIKNEKYCKPVFYGSMITEGIVALIWASVSTYFFYGGGAEALGFTIVGSMPEGGLAANQVLAGDAPRIVHIVSKGWLGAVGSFLAILGVVVAPITSGDTALRSSRMIIADSIGLSQKSLGNRLKMALPIFALTGLLLWFNISANDGFNVLWRYFGWANQSLAALSLWMISVYLLKRKEKTPHYLIALIPACFMTSVVVTFICTQKIGLNLPTRYASVIALLTVLVCLYYFFKYKKQNEL